MKEFINKKNIVIILICLIVLGVILIQINKKKEPKIQSREETNTSNTISTENDINILKTSGENITVNNDELEILNIVNISSQNAFDNLNKIYKVNDKANLYSVSKIKNDLGIGSKLKKANRDSASDQVYLILRMSYPIISLEEMGLETEEEAYQATQIALWEICSRTGESKETELITRIDLIKEKLENNNISINNKVFNKAKELVKYVENFDFNNPKDGLELVPTLMVNNSLVDLIKQPDEEENKYLVGPYKFYIKNGYFIDSDIIVNDENGNKINAKYVDRNGNTLNNIGENTEFYLSFKEFPENVKYKLNFNAKVKRIVTEFYENNNKEYIANTYTVVEIPLELTINFEKPNTLGEIELTVYDENGNLQSGATIILYDSANNELGRSVTGRDGKINYYKVPEGAYKLIEVDDDEKEIQSKEIEVRAGEITKVDFTN